MAQRPSTLKKLLLTLKTKLIPSNEFPPTPQTNQIIGKKKG